MARANSVSLEVSIFSKTENCMQPKGEIAGLESFMDVLEAFLSSHLSTCLYNIISSNLIHVYFFCFDAGRPLGFAGL